MDTFSGLPQNLTQRKGPRLQVRKKTFALRCWECAQKQISSRVATLKGSGHITPRWTFRGIEVQTGWVRAKPLRCSSGKHRKRRETKEYSLEMNLSPEF